MNHLLIVDDDHGTRESLRAVFAPDYEITLASCAGEAKRILQSKSIDLVLLDVVMPDQDGISLAREIAGAYPEMPVVMVSASHSIEPVVESMRAGAADFIKKPFDIDDIRYRVARPLGHLPGPAQTTAPDSVEFPINLDETIHRFEQKLISKALSEAGGVQTQAARLLGTTRRILRYRMDKLDIPLPDKKPKT